MAERLVFGILVALGALWVVGGAFMVTQDPGAWPPIVVGVALMGLALLVRKFLRALETDTFDLRRVAPWVFVGGGGLFLVVGAWVVLVHDTDGLWAMAFGGVFVGVGLLVRKLFAVPPGLQEVAVEERSVGVSPTGGGSGTREQRQVILVDANASKADVARARADWTRVRLAERPDWTSGRIVEDDARNAGSGRWAAVALTGLALVLGIVAGLSGEAFLGFAAFVVGVAAAVNVFHAVRAARRHGKFGTSLLALTRTPVALGARLGGTVLTGVPSRTPTRFRLVLECAHHWEESVGSGDDMRTRYRREVLWRAEAETFGEARSDGAGTAVPLGFELPADRPGTTLGGGSEGIRWELEVSAPLPGLDFGASFTLPVLPAEEIAAEPAAVQREVGPAPAERDRGGEPRSSS